jgi:hypothetical protein
MLRSSKVQTVGVSLMTEHTTAIKVPTFPDEFKPLLKLMQRALCETQVRDALAPDELHKVGHWLNDFQSLALEFAE